MAAVACTLRYVTGTTPKTADDLRGAIASSAHATSNHFNAIAAVRLRLHSKFGA